MENPKKRGRPKKQKDPSDFSTKDKLEEIVNAIPQDADEQDPPALPVVPQEDPAEPQASTGLLAYIVCRGFDIYLLRSKKDPLAAHEKELLSEPCNEIEAKYISQMVRGYMEKTSPFAKLIFEGFLVLKTRNIEPVPVETISPEPSNTPPQAS